MSHDRLVRVNELLKREIATALYRVMTEGGFDFAAVTITGVETSSDLRTANVRVSIFGHEGGRDKILGRIRHHARDIQKIVGKNVILKYNPHLHFELDTSIEQGDHVLQILTELEGRNEPPQDDATKTEEP